MPGGRGGWAGGRWYQVRKAAGKSWLRLAWQTRGKPEKKEPACWPPSRPHFQGQHTEAQCPHASAGLFKIITTLELPNKHLPEQSPDKKNVSAAVMSVSFKGERGGAAGSCVTFRAIRKRSFLGAPAAGRRLPQLRCVWGGEKNLLWGHRGHVLGTLEVIYNLISIYGPSRS